MAVLALPLAMLRSRLRPCFSLSLYACPVVAFAVAFVWPTIETSVTAGAAAAEPTAETIYNFKGGSRGISPSGAMALDATGVLGVPGALYGTTEYGGSGSGCESNHPLTDGCGTIYRLSPPTPERERWLHEVLYSFAIDNPPTLRGNRGIWPVSGVVLDVGRKALYGSTRDGGGGCPAVYANCGTIFALTPPATAGKRWRYRVLHRFEGGTADGIYPVGDLLLRGRFLYGVTEAGGLGPFGYGTVFQLTRPSEPKAAWKHKLLHRFRGGGDGATPRAGLALGPNNSLYGTTNFGGGCASIPEVGCGVVYRLLPPEPGETRWTEEVIYRFKGGGNGHFPMTGVAVHSTTGLVIGTTRYGGTSNAGILFSLKPPETTSGSRAGDKHTFTKERDESSPNKVLAKIEEGTGALYFVSGKDPYGLSPEVLAVELLVGLPILNLRGWNSKGASGSGARGDGDKFYLPCDNCNTSGRIEVYGPSE